MSDLERTIHFVPGYDKRHPDSRRDQGIHGVSISFILRGRHGAIQFEVITDWYPKHVQQERCNQGARLAQCEIQPMVAVIGYHAYEPQYEGQEPLVHPCAILDGAPCYYDVSVLAAEPIRDRLLAEGDKAVWEEMEQCYVSRFGALE